MKALITGGRGLLGQELASILPNATTYDHNSLDITDESQIWHALTSRRVDVVFHCAGATNVDACEKDPAGARRVNAVGARTVASVCASLGIYLMTVSTDYVLSGKPGVPLTEEANPRPLSVYAKTKLEGENAVQAVNPNAAIVRTSWLYGNWRETFVDRVLMKGAAREPMSISSDQVSSPTWVRELAPAMVRLAARRPSGIFHLTNEGATPRDEWARAILEAANLDPALVESVVNYPAPARRPRFSALTNCRARDQGITLPNWRTALEAYVSSNDAYEATVA